MPSRPPTQSSLPAGTACRSVRTSAPARRRLPRYVVLTAPRFAPERLMAAALRITVIRSLPELTVWASALGRAA
jgi:hypothetical protein